jgi:hypothetical protein
MRYKKSVVLVIIISYPILQLDESKWQTELIKARDELQQLKLSDPRNINNNFIKFHIFIFCVGHGAEAAMTTKMENEWMIMTGIQLNLLHDEVEKCKCVCI